VTNFSYNGILTIQDALAAGEALSTEEVPIKIRLVAPPLYVMVSNTTDKVGAIERLEQAIEAIGEVIRKEEGGSLNVKMRPKAVSETDDLELAALMDRVARENKEVSGTFSDFLLSLRYFVHVLTNLCGILRFTGDEDSEDE
jgi:translation initiation factor 2 subunit 1